MEEQWMKDPALKGMDKKKLEFLTNFAAQAKNANKDAMLPLLLSVTSQANNRGISFSNAETDLLVRILSSNMSPAQKKQLESMRKMAGMMSKKR